MNEEYKLELAQPVLLQKWSKGMWLDTKSFNDYAEAVEYVEKLVGEDCESEPSQRFGKAYFGDKHKERWEYMIIPQ